MRDARDMRDVCDVYLIYVQSGVRVCEAWRVAGRLPSR